MKQFERTDKIRVIREVACDFFNQIFANHVDGDFDTLSVS